METYQHIGQMRGEGSGLADMVVPAGPVLAYWQVLHMLHEEGNLKTTSGG
jgi:hypothetical protein